MRTFLISASALAGVTAILAVETAYAQTPASAEPTPQESVETDESDAIIVTANRREENVQQVPASISVIGGSQLERAGITNSNEIAQAVPNVTITSTFNNSNPRIFIRGVGTADFNPNAASPVGVYFDDVYLASTNALQFQLYDVQRVEVLRGPQGTLYGRNTTAGAIKYFSNQPTNDFSADGKVRFGNLDDRAIEGAISGPLASDALTARFAFVAEKRDGNTVNRLTGRDTGNDIRSWGARALFKIEPANDWNIMLNLHGGRASPHTVVYKPRGTICPPGGDPVAFECADILGYQDSSDLYSVANNVVGREIVETYGGSIAIEKDLGWATLTSITAADRVTLDRVEDSDGSPNQLLEITYDHDSRQVSQEVRVTSPGGRNVNWITGAYYFREKVKFNNKYDILRSLRPFFGFDPANFVVLVDQAFVQHDRAVAVFGRVDVALTDRVKLTGGLRYTHERKRFTEDVALAEPGFTIPVFTVGDRLSNGRVSGDIILDYQVTDDLLLYGSVSRGFKSGGFNGGVVFNPAEVTSFGPETLTSYEAGFKAQTTDRRVTFNASAFYYDYKDLQVYTVVNDPDSGIPIQALDNAASARVYGLEANGAFEVFPEFKLYGSIGLLNSKFKEFQSDVAANDFTGNRLARAPELTSSLGASFRRPVSDKYRISASVDTSYRSKIFFDASNRERLSQDGYWLANARVGFEPQTGAWEVAAWAKNIFDKQYYRDIIDLSIFGFDGTTVGDPATYGVEVSVHF